MTFQFKDLKNRMHMQLILAAFLVSVGFISAQAKDQKGVEAPVSDKPDEIKIGRSFWKLFDSITNNDMRKTETYRKFLGQQSVNEQHAFDRVKKELWFARRKNSDNRGNFHHRDRHIKVATAFKRETPKNKTEDPNNPRRNMKWVEKEFVRHLIPGRGYHDSYLALWSRDKQEALCIRSMNNTFQFHDGKTVDVVPKTIKFRWEKHEPIKVDAIKCPARNRFIYESRRERDCYVVLATDEYRNDPPEEVYIFYEICELGLM